LTRTWMAMAVNSSAAAILAAGTRYFRQLLT
jgi:hypothetical protein